MEFQEQVVRSSKNQDIQKSPQRPSDYLKRAFAKRMLSLSESIPESPTLAVVEAVRPDIPHLEAAIEWIQWLPDKDVTLPYKGLGHFYEGQALYKQALPWRQQCLENARTRLGEKHLDVADGLNDLAVLHRKLGHYSEAEPLNLAALELRKELLGNEHLDVAKSLKGTSINSKMESQYEIIVKD